MRCFFKQKGGPVGFALALASICLIFSPIQGQTILSQWEKGTLKLRLSPEMRDALEPAFPDLSRATQRLLALIGQRPVDRPLVIWLLKNQDEQKSVLLQLGYDPTKFSGPAIRSNDQVLLIVKPGTPRDWLLRYILSEYARYHLFSDTSEDGMEWFRTGMAVSTGWFVQEEVEKGDWATSNAKLLQYYASRLKPDPELALEQLSKPGAWKKNLEKKDKGQMIARATLLYVWATQKSGPGSGASVLNFWTSEKDMAAALRRGADISLDDLSRRLTDAEKISTH
ncbi:MAG: hypothetical protein K8S54_01310 [Spirochaetia bacterium]|nr:hypothetical protein [Spirochaetia bacterium]